MSRASLASLLLFFFWVSLVASAPVPERLSSLDLAERFVDDYDLDLTTRYWDDDLLEERDLDYLEEDDVFQRGFVGGPEEFIVLQRRNILDNIKHAFQSFGQKIKSGFQKVGHAFQRAGQAIKSGFQKAGHAIKSGFQKFGHVVKSGFQKAGRAIKSGFQKAGHAIKSGFQKVGHAFKKAGHAIKSGFQKFGHAVKSGFQKAGHAIKSGFQKAGAAMKKGFQKAGHWFKTTGAKIAKFGLKVLSTVQSVASRFVKFIPGIGQPLSMAMEGSSMGLNKASEAIHVSLGSQLDKGMEVMDVVRDPIGAGVKAASSRIRRH